MRCVQGLQQIVADRGKEAALGIVRPLGLAARAIQHLGAFGHAMLQRFVDALEARLGLAEGGDIGEGGDEAAARHRVATDLDDAAIGKHALGQMAGACAHVGQAPLQCLAFLRRLADAGDFAQRPGGGFGDRHPDPQHAGWVIEQLLVATIPGHQPQVGIDHADALGHVLERCFQHPLVEAQVLAGLADDGGHGIEIRALLVALGGIKQQARGGAAEDRGQLVFHPRFDGRRHRALFGRMLQQLVHPRRRQEASAGIAQGLQVRAACLVPPWGAAHGRDQQGRRGADEQADAHRATQPAPAGQSEHCIRRQPVHAERPVVEPCGQHAQRGGEHRHQHHPRPCREPRQHAGRRRVGRRLRAPHRESQRGRQCRQGRKRHRADIGQRFTATHQPAVGPAQQHDGDDADPTQHQQLAAAIPALPARPSAMQQAWREPVVADHQAERQRADDDHARRRTEAPQVHQQRDAAIALRQRQCQRIHVGGHAMAEQRRARACQGQGRQRDQQQVERELPARGAHVALVSALHHADVELMRHQEHRQRAQDHQRHEAAGRLCGRDRRHVWDVAQFQPDERAEHQHRAQLEHRLERHGQHQAAIVFGCTGAAGTEEDREHGHRQRHVQAAVSPYRRNACTRGLRALGQGGEAERDRLQLQRDVRDQPEHRDQRHHGGQPCVLAEARGDQVGKRGGIAFMRQPDQPDHEEHGQGVEEDGADERRGERPAVARGLGHGAVERPRGAVHRQRQGIDVPPIAGQQQGPALRHQCHDEHQQQQCEAAGDDDGGAQHVAGNLRGGWRWVIAEA